MGKGRAKRPKPAVYKRDEAAELTQRLLRIYAADPKFQDSLRRFAEDHEEVIRRLAEAEEQSSNMGAFEKLRLWGKFWSSVETYHADTLAFAEHWGLDRLPDQLGIDALHSFCVDRFKTGENFDDLPRSITDNQDFERAVLEKFGQLSWSPVAQPIEIYFQGEWPAAQEPQTEARKRLINIFAALLDHELDRVAEEFRLAGFEFRDIETKWVDDRLVWTYRRLAHRESIKTILDNLPTDPDQSIDPSIIRNETKKVRERLGFEEFPRPFSRRH